LTTIWIRILDICLSFLGLVLLGLILPFVWLIQRLDSPGPLFYKAERVGQNMCRFPMYKFRTMMDVSTPVGECLCAQFDPRVTRFGKFLRKTKLNELPQMINILRGDMSFVGPRPESPELAGLYPEEARKVFSSKPGLVGPASVHGRNEEECYPVGVDVKGFYIDNLLPLKLKLDLTYLQKPSILQYLKYIMLGVMETVRGLPFKRYVRSNQDQTYIMMLDTFLSTCSYVLSYNLYVWFLSGNLDSIQTTRLLPIIILVRLFCNNYFGLYGNLVRYTSEVEVKGAVKSAAIGSILLILFAFIMDKNSYSLFIAIVDFATSALTMGGARAGMIVYFCKKGGKGEIAKRSRIALYGACDIGYFACRALIADVIGKYEVVGFIDDAPERFGKTLYGKKILGNRHHLVDIAKLYAIDELIVADHRVAKDALVQIVSHCAQTGIKCKIIDSPNPNTANGDSPIRVRDVNLSDLLKCGEGTTGDSFIETCVRHKTVLLFGSGGMWAPQLCKKLLATECKRLLLVDRYEAYLNRLMEEVSVDNSGAEIIPVITDIKASSKIESIYSKYKPHIVIHACLRKYPMTWDFGEHGIEDDNRFRNMRIAEISAKFGCEVFILVSTQYAKNPSSTIDKNLKNAEQITRDYFQNTSTRLVIARLGDTAESLQTKIALPQKRNGNKSLSLRGLNENLHIHSKEKAADLILRAVSQGCLVGKISQDMSCESTLELPAHWVATAFTQHPGLES
jgi:lipopolysaccharide/colanic/teichoic acid biosynthesis glycosyltransferase/FlaA1/EpsC-like NDP-sugar epimerase